MSVTLEQIFSAPLDEIYRISGNSNLKPIDAYILVAEKYMSAKQLIEADMYYIRDNHDIFAEYLRYVSNHQIQLGAPINMGNNLENAIQKVKVHNSRIIIQYINKLIVDGNTSEAIRIRKSYNVTDSELYITGIDFKLRPKRFLIQFGDNYDSVRIIIDYAKVYNLNDPGVISKIEHSSNYDVLNLFSVFFEKMKTYVFTLVDSYFDIYNIPKNRYWYVYSLLVLYSDQNGYTNDYISNYITNHESNIAEAEKGDLVILIFMAIVFNIANGAMYKDLIYGYNTTYPNEENELNSALTYCMREIFNNSRWVNLHHVKTTYPKVNVPDYLNYSIYNSILFNTEYNLGNQETIPLEMQRLTQNNNYIDEVRRIIYSTSPFTKKIL